MSSLNVGNLSQGTEIAFEDGTVLSSLTFIFANGGIVAFDGPSGAWSGMFAGSGSGSAIHGSPGGTVTPNGLTFNFTGESEFVFEDGRLAPGATNAGEFLLLGGDVDGLANSGRLRMVMAGGMLSNLVNSGTVEWAAGTLAGHSSGTGVFSVQPAFYPDFTPLLEGTLQTGKVTIEDGATLLVGPEGRLEVSLLEFDLTEEVALGDVAGEEGSSVTVGTVRKLGANSSATVTAGSLEIQDTVEVQSGQLEFTAGTIGTNSGSRFNATVAHGAELAFGADVMNGAFGTLQVDGLLVLGVDAPIERLEGDGSLLITTNSQSSLSTVAARPYLFAPAVLKISHAAPVFLHSLQVLGPLSGTTNVVDFENRVLLGNHFNVTAPDLTDLLGLFPGTKEFTILTAKEVVSPTDVPGGFRPSLLQPFDNGQVSIPRSTMTLVIDASSVRIRVEPANPFGFYSGATYLDGDPPDQDSDGDGSPDAFDALQGAPRGQSTPAPTVEAEELELSEGEEVLGRRVEALGAAAELMVPTAEATAEVVRRRRFSISVPVSLDFDFEASGWALALEKRPSLSTGDWERVTNLRARRTENAVVLVDGDLYDPAVVSSMFYRAVIVETP